jgi:hypothetical protein
LRIVGPIHNLILSVKSIRFTLAAAAPCCANPAVVSPLQLGLVADWTGCGAERKHRVPRDAIDGYVNPAFGAAVHNIAQVLRSDLTLTLAGRRRLRAYPGVAPAYYADR